MAFNVTAFRVLIASPSDTADARRALVEAINEWNDLNAESLGVVLLPTLWEISAAPEMGDRPQAIINRQLVDKCDILVGTFWTRLGTPTGVSVSGTAEEIEGFVSRKATVLLYFSNQPVVPGTLDPEQLKALADYKANLLRRGLCSDYEAITELTHKVQRDLRRAVEGLITGSTSTIASNTSAASSATFGEENNAEQVKGQLRRIAAETATLLKIGIDSDDVDGVRRVMGNLGFQLATVLGEISSVSQVAEESDRGQALRALAEQAAELERFQVYLDGGKTWGELVEAAEHVIGNIRALASSDWASVFERA